MPEVLCGHHSIREALRAGRRRVHRLLVAEGIREGGDVGRILRAARERRVPLERVKRRQLDALGSNVHHQGMAAQVSSYPYADWPSLLDGALEGDDPPLLLLLDRLQDPQNVGTLLRTAEAVGVHGVAIPRHRSAEITPAVSRASAGAVEHLRIAKVTNLSRTISELKQSGVWVAGLERAPGSMSYAEARLDGPLALVVGSEGGGLGRLVRESCDLLIELPMRGSISSLNAAVAGSIALYLIWRARTG